MATIEITIRLSQSSPCKFIYGSDSGHKVPEDNFSSAQRTYSRTTYSNNVSNNHKSRNARNYIFFTVLTALFFHVYVSI